MALTAAYPARWAHVAGQAIHRKYSPMRIHASGRISPASTSRASTGIPRRGRCTSSTTAHTITARYDTSM